MSLLQLAVQAARSHNHLAIREKEFSQMALAQRDVWMRLARSVGGK
jgi:hypothetical protein